MASAAKYPYLTRCVENLADMPGELQRYFKSLRDLDDKSQKLMKAAEEKVRVVLGMGRHDSATPSKRLRLAKADCAMDAEMAQQVNEVLLLAGEKYEVSKQAYDYVDKAITQLDAEMKKYQAELKRDRQKLNIPENETATQILNAKEAARKGTSTAKQKGGRGARKREAEEALALQVPVAETVAIDPNAEPRYCLCNGFSAGEMVACENESCDKEWFHFECVGLTEAPLGAWYCPNCIGLVQQQ